MKTARRTFIAGLLATGLAPTRSWADAGGPTHLSAAARHDGAFVLCGLDAALNITFRLPLPARGHAAVAHPERAQAVAFARRPGTFAMVIDCTTGAPDAMLEAPAGRHFYGHGTFSRDGHVLYTTENDFEAGRGVIGLWDVAAGYARIGEWDSGGIGPHDIKRLAGRDILVVANGGIDTHPASGRTKLNIPTMRPNLSYLSGGKVVDRMDLPDEMHKNSIRHLAVTADGRVAFGMQWQGGGTAPSLVGLHALGAGPVFMACNREDLRDMQGYVGSIAASRDGARIVVTSPRGGKVQVFDGISGRLIASRAITDVCGVATGAGGHVLTSGTGEIAVLRQDRVVKRVTTELRWDNHLIPI